jgi:hypothetical protein
MAMKFLRMLALGSLVLGCCTATANSENLVRSVGGKSVDLAMPPGFCVPDMGNAADANFVKGLSSLLKNANNVLVQTFLSCDDQKRRRAAATANIYDYMSYYYPAPAENVVVNGARDASRKSLCDEIRKTNIDATEVKQNVAKSAEELRRNIALNSIKNLGVLAEDAHGCYLGLLAGVSAGKDNTYLVNAIIFSTVVHGKYLFFGLYSKYVDAASADKTLAAAKAIGAELDSKNPD